MLAQGRSPKVKFDLPFNGRGGWEIFVCVKDLEWGSHKP